MEKKEKKTEIQRIAQLEKKWEIRRTTCEDAGHADHVRTYGVYEPERFMDR